MSEAAGRRNWGLAWGTLRCPSGCSHRLPEGLLTPTVCTRWVLYAPPLTTHLTHVVPCACLCVVRRRVILSVARCVVFVRATRASLAHIVRDDKDVNVEKVMNSSQ